MMIDKNWKLEDTSLSFSVKVTSGLLLASKSGSETRHRIADQTNEIPGSIRENVYRTKEDIERSPRFRSAAETAEKAKESVREAAERRARR